MFDKISNKMAAIYGFVTGLVLVSIGFGIGAMFPVNTIESEIVYVEVEVPTTIYRFIMFEKDDIQENGDFTCMLSGEEFNINELPENSELIPVTITSSTAFEIEEPKIQFYDVPLADEIQLYLFELAEKYNVDPVLLLAMIWTESTFRPNIISKTNDYGLMQINRVNHSWLKRDLGITNFLDPYQNILAGTHMIGGYLEKYDIHKALMAYNQGEKSAINSKYASSSYSRRVVGFMDEIHLRED